MKLIDKDALVAEIERLRKEDGNPYFPSETADKYYARGVHFTCDGLANFLDTFEVKEVDLEKELDNWRHNHFHGRRDKEASGEYLERSSQLDIAKHFYGLGLKAQKGE